MTARFLGSGRGRSTAILVALLAVSACGRDAGVVVLDLVEEQEQADHTVERGMVEFGRPAARPLLRGGWSLDVGEHDDGTPFAWGVGRFSAFDLWVVEPRPLTLSLEGRPATRTEQPAAAHRPDELRVEVNAWSSATLPLVRGEHAYRVEVPASAVRAGANRVELHYQREGRRIGRLGRDLPHMAWTRARVDSAWSLDVPRGADDVAELRLPYHTGVDFYARVPAGARLTLDGLSTTGSEAASPALEVALAVDGLDDPETVLVSPPWWGAPPSVPVPVPDPEAGATVVRISLRAVPGQSGPVPGGLSLARPRVIASAPFEGPPGGGTPVRPSAADARIRPDDGVRLADGEGASRRRPNVIVYLVDTLRADHLGVYGYPRDTSPHVDALARDGIVFTNPVAQSAWTRTSVASILTGLHPRSHGVHGRRDSLSPAAATLQTILQDAGYRTGAVVTNGNVSRAFGFDHGFETFEHLREQQTREVHTKSDAVTDRAIAWLEAHDRTRPFLLYLHTVDPHSPYAPRSPFAERFAPAPVRPDLYRTRDLAGARLPTEERAVVRSDVIDLYDAEIAFNDQQFGRLVDWLRAEALYDDTLIVFTSDHGEEFLDHGRWGHGATLFREQLFVPLVVKRPGQVDAGRRVDATVQHIDLLPTVLDVVGVTPEVVLPGRPLFGAFSGDDPARAIASDLQLDHRRMESLTGPRYKLIRYLTAADRVRQTAVYDLHDDLEERRDLRGRRAVLNGYLDREFDRELEAYPGLFTAGTGEIDAELEERLRALGYIR